MHFHIGSQIPDIQNRQRAVREAARYYAKLKQLGFPLEYLDVAAASASITTAAAPLTTAARITRSANTRADVVYNVADVCNEEKVPHPTLISESGRAIVAHHSVLLVDIFGVIEKTKAKPFVLPEGSKPPKPVADLLELRATLNRKKPARAFPRRGADQGTTRRRASISACSIWPPRRRWETLFWEIAEAVVRLFRGSKSIPDEINDLKDSLGDQFLCNFSVFSNRCSITGRSASFSLSRPIHRLNEAPEHNSTLVDIHLRLGRKDQQIHRPATVKSAGRCRFMR